ncbi:hypothetical protein ACFQS1_37635 [Paractinoplanes rhizophilus]|uniref:Uncharacterized protein n=1 Tax=Paractinoplanes rhizophilus TaxID=1416877 RepID=A0ABW2I4H9_9ACTN
MGSSLSDTFEFIDVEYATSLQNETPDKPSMVQMCTWLKVSRSGYYDAATTAVGGTPSRT